VDFLPNCHPKISTFCRLPWRKGSDPKSNSIYQHIHLVDGFISSCQHCLRDFLRN
jgi:hypothetical protein